MPAERIGQMLADTYRLVRLIGKGGMGSVYEAEHVRLPSRFAVKFLHAEALRQPEIFERFRREAEIASAIGHPNIVYVVDFNVAPDGAPYMVLEYLDGEDLGQRLRRRPRLPVPDAVRIADEIGDALHAAHERGVVHRDLKPQNVFLIRHRRRDDFVKVVDFGISKVLGSTSVATRTGAIFGSPNYMSPEQVEGEVHLIDRRTDVWALGTILYEMLAGRMAFDAPSLVALFNQIVSRAPPPLAGLRPDLPPALAEVVRRALAKPIEDRFPTMAEMCDAIRAAAGGTGRAAVPASPEPEGPEASEAPHEPAPAPTLVTPPPATDPSVEQIDAGRPHPTTFTRGTGETLRQPRRARSLRLPALVGAVGGALAIAVVVWWPPPPPELVRIRAYSNPTDARCVGPDSKDFGATPCVIDWPRAAPLALTLVKEGYETLAIAVPTGRSGDSGPHALVRVPEPPMVRVRLQSDPSDAGCVGPGGRDLGTTPCEIEWLRGAPLEVTLVKDGWEPLRVKVPTDRAADFGPYRLARTKVRIVLKSDPPGARCLGPRGQDFGTTPCEIEWPRGEPLTVTLRKPDWKARTVRPPTNEDAAVGPYDLEPDIIR